MMMKTVHVIPYTWMERPSVQHMHLLPAARTLITSLEVFAARLNGCMSSHWHRGLGNEVAGGHEYLLSLKQVKKILREGERSSGCLGKPVILDGEGGEVVITFPHFVKGYQAAMLTPTWYATCVTPV